MGDDLQTAAGEGERRRLVEAFGQLPLPDRRMVQLLSVIHLRVDDSTLTRCLNSLGKKRLGGRSIAARQLTARLRELAGAGLVSREVQGSRCHPGLAEVATRAAIEDQAFAPICAAIRRYCHPYTTPGVGLSFGIQSPEVALCQLRLALYEGDAVRLQAMLAHYARRYGGYEDEASPLERICLNPFDQAWFSTLGPDVWIPVLSRTLRDQLYNLEPPGEVFRFMQQQLEQDEDADQQLARPYLRLFMAEQRMAQGRPEEALECFRSDQDAARYSFEGWLELLRGEHSGACERYAKGLHALGGRYYFSSLAGPFHVLALACSGDRADLAEARRHVHAAGRDEVNLYGPLFHPLEALLAAAAGDPIRAGLMLRHGGTAEELRPLELVFWALAEQRIDQNHAARLVPLLEPVAVLAERSGYLMIAALASEILGELGSAPRTAHARRLREQWGGRPLLSQVKSRQLWEQSLEALIALGRPTDKGQQRERLVWNICHVPDERMAVLEPRIQRVSKRGGWTRGRKVSMQHLASDRSPSVLTAHDRQICACVQDTCWYTPELDLEQALPALVGHPLVFWLDNPSERVELVAGEPELVVSRDADRVALTMVPSPFPSAATIGRRPGSSARGNLSNRYRYSEEVIVDTVGPHLLSVVVDLEGPARLRITTFSEEHQRIARILGQDGLQVPGQAEQQVLDVIDSVAPSITIQSDIGAGDSAALAVVEPDNRPRFLLTPLRKGLRAQLWVRPLDSGGPYYRPGGGGETVVAEVNGKRVRARRDRELELRLAAAAVERCPALAGEDPEATQWQYPQLEQALEVMLQLHELGDQVVVEWPEGQRLKLRGRTGMSALFMRISGKGDWFEADGELRMDEQTVLQMKDLLRLSELAEGRFVPLGEGEFVALTRDLRQRLGDLRAFSEQRGQSLRFSALAATALGEMVEELGGLEADDAWEEHLERIRRAGEFTPELPSNLRATLRDYQHEGFCWLARLAHWGVGACLADDMGLGKTVQALAVILTRAGEGPTLVVAPTSVCGNWDREARRFAPTLRLRSFSARGRQQLLSSLGPHDVLVCSYGLLRVVVEKLAEVDWQTVVLDEAQAIKNAATKNSRAAMKLRAGLKLITTGTPIENHLGELWNLVRFINPGLLGSRQSFDARFAIPIEKHGDSEARLRLKRLVQPFILRRTKDQVLEELPSRTEVMVDVAMGRREAALYEALRQQALDRLGRAGADGPGHLQVLAELTRLRRACCNPRLVAPESTVPSAKLDAFKELLQGLAAGGHRALVFSQFVTHLAIVRELVRNLELDHQYLDGSTPAAERMRRVDAFQGGEGEVFLISLKAGGQGLNLTAADYVIHLDPWWNPAVEDQASDRAHRIGQHRPVTIYRLVVKGTIEEKIVRLHEQKRDLARGLLEGTDSAGRLSTEELLALLKDGIG